MSSNKHLQAAGYSIASNIFVQILSRSFTFVLKAITLHLLQSSSLLGIINVRLALLYTTLQFLSREPFRRACLGGAAKSEAKTWPRVVNTIWLGLLMSISLAFPLARIWRSNAPSIEDLAGTNIDDYQLAVSIICISVIVEMLAEPCLIYSQAKAISDHAPKVEVSSVILKSILMACVTALEATRFKSGVSSYILSKIAGCQLVASVVLVVYAYARLQITHKITPTTFLPTLNTGPSSPSSGIRLVYRYLDESSIKLSYGFMCQAFLKQLLAESERYVMTFFNVISLSEQGIYDVVNNLGSVAARMVFKPVEDSGYTLFSQTVSRTETLDIRRFYRVQENLMFLTKAMLLIGLIILTFGYNFVPLIVIYGGEKLNNLTAFSLMKWQLFYTPILAVNGITECFTSAVMSSKEIRIYNYCLILFSFVFLISIRMTQPYLGSACFIFANCLTMLSRIIYSYKHISSYFHKHDYHLRLQDTLPSLTTLISMSGVFIFLSISQSYLLDLSQPLSVVFGLILGGWCLVFIIHVIMCHEEDLLNFISRLFKIKLI